MNSQSFTRRRWSTNIWSKRVLNSLSFLRNDQLNASRSSGFCSLYASLKPYEFNCVKSDRSEVSQSAPNPPRNRFLSATSPSDLMRWANVMTPSLLVSFCGVLKSPHSICGFLWWPLKYWTIPWVSMCLGQKFRQFTVLRIPPSIAYFCNTHYN